jgi:cyclophilin family peptidyl-prolyl cis-trans isomerase
MWKYDKEKAQNTLSMKNKTYTAILKTSAGEITIELNVKETPITVNNFISLAKNNFYNNTVFHRVIKGFMIQGGDPKGDGTGGPGYKFNDEPFKGEYTRGTVAMANAGSNTNGSQFFIMQQDNPLPKNYVIFGKVISGIDVVDKIAEAPITRNPSGEMSKPIQPVTVESVEINMGI